MFFIILSYLITVLMMHVLSEAEWAEVADVFH